MKILQIIVFIVISISATAQQGLQMQPVEQDSAQIEFERKMEYRQLISGNSANLLIDEVRMPAFDISEAYRSRYAVNLNFYALAGLWNNGFSAGRTSSFYSPFYQNGMVLSEGIHQLGDKFVLGGYSYGANSIFSAPNPHPGSNNFDTYGNTLFMQYKVSKNFKIETRINVSQGAMPGF